MINLKMQNFYRLLAEKEIRVPNLIRIARGVSMINKLSEQILQVENEVHIRLGEKEDLDFITRFEEPNIPGGHILSQAARWWNELGFRCLIVGYFKDESRPFCLNHVLDDSYNSRFKDMGVYANLYQPLTEDAAHTDGSYVLNNFRGKGLFFKFSLKRNKILFQSGKRLIRSHWFEGHPIAILRNAIKVGSLPDHWISQVTINLRFFSSNVFIHHRIKDSDRDKFPLTLFDRSNE